MYVYYFGQHNTVKCINVYRVCVTVSSAPSRQHSFIHSLTQSSSSWCCWYVSLSVTQLRRSDGPVDWSQPQEVSLWDEEQVCVSADRQTGRLGDRWTDRWTRRPAGGVSTTSAISCAYTVMYWSAGASITRTTAAWSHQVFVMCGWFSVTSLRFDLFLPSSCTKPVQPDSSVAEEIDALLEELLDDDHDDSPPLKVKLEHEASLSDRTILL